MGLCVNGSGAEELRGTVTPVTTQLESPHDPKVHSVDERFEPTKAQELPMQQCGEEDEEEEEELEAENEDQDDDADTAAVKRPLLQGIKMTRTSSKKKMQSKMLHAKMLSSSENPSSDSTMVPVTAVPSPEARMKRIRGLGYIVFAALNISLMSACIKYATHHITSHEAVFWRSLLTWILNYALIRTARVDLHVPPKHRRMLLLRCFIGMICISLAYYAMSKMVLTDAIVIIFTSPVLTFLLGALVLGESIERADFVCALMSYVGVLFVTRPAMLFPQNGSSKATDTLAVVCALGAAAAQACVYIVMRKLQDVHYMVISHHFSFFGIGFSLALLWIFDTPLRIPELFTVQLALFASAVFSCIGMIFLTLGLQMEKAGIASVMRYFDVVFVFILDTLCLGETVDAYSILGGLIIISGAVIIAVRRARAKK